MRSDLEYFNVRKVKESLEYVLPEGLIILDDDSPISIIESELEILNGINGAKMLLSS